MVQSWRLGIGLFGLSLAMLGTPLSIPVEVRAEGQTAAVSMAQPTDPPSSEIGENAPINGENAPINSEVTSAEPQTIELTQETGQKDTESRPEGTDLPVETTSPPSAQKSALIRQLLVITDQKKNSEQHLESVLTNMEETLPQVLANVIRDRTQLEGDALLQRVTTTTQRLIKRYRELLPSRVNIGEVTEEISTNLYAKYFTEQELQDLIDFYKTPTGRKTIATLPQLTKEAIEQSNKILLPEITQLLQQIMQEEFGPAPQKPKEDKTETKP